MASSLETAARRAESRGAPPAAAELYERAVRLTPPEARKDVLRRTIDQAFCTFQSGDGRRARALLDAVVAELEAGPERARALISLARVRSYDDDIRAAEGLFRQAIEEAGGDDELLAAAGENLASILFRLRERLDEAVEHASAAAAAATAAGKSRLALGGARRAGDGGGRAGSARAGGENARSRACAATRVRGSAGPGAAPIPGGGGLALVGRLDRAKKAFEWLLGRAREMGDEGSLPYILVLAAQVECVRGDVRLAAAHADEGYALDRAGRPGHTRRLPARAARACALDSGRGTGGARMRRAGPSRLRTRRVAAPRSTCARTALGALELSLGRAAETTEVLGPLVAFLRREQHLRARNRACGAGPDRGADRAWPP